jgi:hypothetical protein
VGVVAHPIPVRLEDFDPQLITGALERNGVDATVSDVAVEPIGAGGGFLGELARLHLRYDGTGPAGPPSLVAKIPTRDEGLKPLGMLLGVYEREARFYDELAAEMKVRVPYCFYNEWDNESESFALLLEDLVDLTAGDQASGATLDQAMAAMRAAAGVHGRWWNHETITESEWVPSIDNPVNLGLQDLFAASFPTMVDMYGELLGPELIETIERFIPTTADFLISYRDVSVTLVHNDYRLDNMFFGDELALVDWQIIGCGDGSGDFVPFLAANLSTELRRAHETELLQCYLEAMHEQEAGYADMNDLLAAFRGGLTFWLVAWCNSAVSADRPNQRAALLMDGAVERVAAAARDHVIWEYVGDFSWHPAL